MVWSVTRARKIDRLSPLPLQGLPASWESLSPVAHVGLLGKETEAVVGCIWLETMEKACLCIPRSKSLTELIDFMRREHFVPRVVKLKGVTDQQVMGLETVYLRDLIIT